MSTTKQLVAVSLVIATMSIGLLGFGVWTVWGKGNALVAQMTLLGEVATKEAEYQRTEQIIATSADDRAALEGFFISEKDTILLITQIEALASGQGLQLETTQLAVDPKTDTAPGVLKIGFTFTGPQLSVRRMVELLELFPYHKTIPSLTIAAEQGEGVWQGDVIMHITLLP